MSSTWQSRKFVLHVKLSKNDNFIHDHELYEMMRSRQLYNIHIDLRKQLGRTIRGIQNAERVHIANIEAQRLLFLQRVARRAKERLKLTKVYRKPEEQNLGDGSQQQCTAKPSSDVSIARTGVAGVLHLPEFLEKDKTTVMILPSVVNHGHLSRQTVLTRHHTREGSMNIDVGSLPTYHSVRLSRIQTVREYTQLLDRRVRDFRV